MKSSSHTIVSIIVTILLTGIAFYAGTQANTTSTSKDESYSNSLEILRKERDQAYNDYESACTNYQRLYTAYDELYMKVGASSGIEQLVRVDGARGNEDSCYR